VSFRTSPAFFLTERLPAAISALRQKPGKNAFLMEVVKKDRTFGTMFPNNSNIKVL
jgi:hypothetical protein